jgi:hypothetical protein
MRPDLASRENSSSAAMSLLCPSLIARTMKASDSAHFNTDLWFVVLN